jgi:hypothetical protein
MFDHWTTRLVKRPLNLVAVRLKRSGCSPDQITFAAFCIGTGVLPALYLQMYWLALVGILLNRLGTASTERWQG